MHKIQIKGYFKNYSINEKIEYNEVGSLIGNSIIFDKDNTNIKIKFKNDRIIFIKTDENTILEHEFIQNKQTFSKYHLKQENININIPIFTTRIKKEENKLKIEYYLNEDHSNNILNIEYEVLI